MLSALKLGAFFSHHVCPPKWYCEEPGIQFPSKFFIKDLRGV